MRKNLTILLLILQIIFVQLDSPLKLEIYRSKSHEDQTGDLTPLVISLSSDDITEKKNRG
jgi:hypothetical protein